MCSRCLSILLLATAPLFGGSAVLRVCADPNNLPYSNERGEGFENRLAELLARDFGAKLEYTWWSEQRGFLKNSLGAGLCDVVLGVPSALETVTVTRPYYRSTYVFLSRKDRNLHVSSLNDERLAQWRIGIHMVGDDFAPPAVALGRRGLAANLAAFSLHGAYGEENPPERLVHAVAEGVVDVAIVWGPFAGYFATRESAPLEVSPVTPQSMGNVPFTFDMSMAVRKGDDELKLRLEAALQRNCAAVRAILMDYSVPQVALGEPNLCGSPRQLPVSSR